MKQIKFKKISKNALFLSAFFAVCAADFTGCTKEQKTQWLDKFFKRMSTALYKKSIMPPYVIVDSPSYNSKQPITSCAINYKGLSEDVIAEKIKEFI